MRQKALSLIMVPAVLAMLCFATNGALAAASKGKIVHDAEYYILEAQNGERWAAEDKKLDKKLAELKKKNGGKPPNIVYILWDDQQFGSVGFPGIQKNLGYERPIPERKAPCLFRCFTPRASSDVCGRATS